MKYEHWQSLNQLKVMYFKNQITITKVEKPISFSNNILILICATFFSSSLFQSQLVYMSMDLHN